MTPHRNYIGLRSGTLTVIAQTRQMESGARRVRVTCQCDCGATLSCLSQEIVSEKRRSCPGCIDHAKKHGHARDTGASGTYKSWRNMRARVNPVHKHFAVYGGRGIRVCERWAEFKNFLEDMGERPPGKTLDRIDPDGNYEPGNCRWATRKEQQRNRRCCRRFTAFGETLTIVEWSERTGINFNTLRHRFNKVAPETALTRGVWGRL